MIGVFFLSKKWRKIPHLITVCLMLSQVRLETFVYILSEANAYVLTGYWLYWSVSLVHIWG